MNNRDFAELTRYVRWCANEVGLRDWTINLQLATKIDVVGSYEKSSLYVAMGQCHPTPGKKYADVTLQADCRKWDVGFLRRIIIHELIHCHLADMREFPRMYLFDTMPKRQYHAFMFGFDLAWEHATNAIAVDWARLLPMIVWPIIKRGKRRAKR